MPYVDRGGARIWYTVQGTGFPLLTLAPGGMLSSVPLWEVAAINPLTAYAGQYQMIAMDQRNAGQSAGPLEAGDPWGAYAADQLAVMDHLGIDRFLVFGCCIGGAMDLVASGRTVMVMMEHRDSRDRPKVVQRCSYALTGKACVDILVTDLAQFRRKNGGLTVEQVAPGFTKEEVLALTGIDAATSP